ncbi:hypothetical protein BC833DRAFT_385979 [Globomyces pollinis-pini]|nr:hypothetical protein BC833DRAFT_385979 [Globomyces pollinis-pini]
MKPFLIISLNAQKVLPLNNMPNALPIINIEPFVAKQIHLACLNVGFFYLTGHGLSNEYVARIRSLSKEFFSLPDHEKNEISITKTDFARGYQRLGQNITQYAQDWHEGIDLYAPVGPHHPLHKRKSKTLTGVNPIPKQIPEFESIVNDYVVKMKEIGMAVMHGMAMGLGLEEHYFEQFVDDSFWVMRMIGYPQLKQSEDVGISCGEHTDYGCLTILNTDETTGALQVLSKSGKWITADPIPGAFVINIGDMVNNWTNDLYKSTLHRVIHAKSSYRVSVPFFFEPNFDAIIQPLDVCVQASGKAPAYKPIMYGDHLLSKVTNNFDVGENKASL